MVVKWLRSELILLIRTDNKDLDKKDNARCPKIVFARLTQRKKEAVIKEKQNSEIIESWMIYSSFVGCIIS